MTDRRLSKPAAWAVLAIVTLAAMGRLLLCDFTWWDDPHTIHQNNLMNLVKLDSFLHYWSVAPADIYIPLTYNVWALVSIVARVNDSPAGISLNPFFYHALNVFTHIGGAAAAYFLLRRLLKHDLAALAGALFWAVHPIQVEAVGWISGYKDVLAGTLALVSLERFVAWRQDGGRKRFFTSLVLYALAMLSKPSAMTLPLIIVLIDWLGLRSGWRAILKSIWPYVLETVPIAIVARMVQPGSVAHSALWARPFIALDSLAFYVVKILFPLQLCIDYGRNPAWVIHSGMIWYSWLLPTGIAAIVFFLCRRQRKAHRPVDLLPVAGLLVLAAAPLPVLGLVSFDFEAFSTVSDHYVYLALLGPAICVAWAVAKLPRAFFAGICVLLLLYVAKSAAQAATWQDEWTVMNHTVAVNPRSWLAYNNLSNDYSRQNNLPAEEDALLKALEFSPDNPVVEGNLLWHYLMTRQFDLADFYARQVINHYSFYRGLPSLTADPYMHVIGMYVDARRIDEAERYLKEAMRLFPQNGYFRVRQEQIDAMKRDPNFKIDRSPGFPSTPPATTQSAGH